jgi:general secretion pathway protein K
VRRSSSRFSRPRRGVALLAALWLVVAIATVALQFSLEAKERRAIGILASERGVQRAAAMGALALVQAKLEYALRVRPTGTNLSQFSGFDPWLHIDSTLTGPLLVDSIRVDVSARDLGEQLNINQLSENDLRTFFSFVLGDYSKATQLSQTIMDWRDADSLPRPSGAERDAYIKAEMLALPTNAPFGELEELRNVMGMTPEIYAAVAPYLATHGATAVNVNDAPVAVLRALPGMTDPTLSMILQMRSQGRRIDNVSSLFGGGATGRRPIRGQVNSPAAIAQMRGRTTTVTQEIRFDFTVRVGPQAPPTKLTAIVRQAGGNTTTVTYRSW